MSRWLPLGLAVSASPGLAAWVLANRVALAKLMAWRPGAMELVGLVGAMVLSLAVCGGAAALWARRSGTPLATLSGRFLPLLALPSISALFIKNLEGGWPAMTIAFAGWTGLIAIIWAYRQRWALPPLPARAPAIAVGVMATIYAVALSTLAILRHHNLSSGIKDLGIYDSIFWHTIHGDLLGANFVKSGKHLAAHCDPILILLSPLYLIYPRAELILVLQSVWLASGAVPVWLLARAKLGASWSALAIPAVWLLYPPLHGTNLYDFHSLTLIAPLVMWAVYLLEIGAWRRYLLVFVLLLLCREDVSLLCCGLGLWIIASGKGWRLGVATIVIAIAYLAFLKLKIMPDPNLLMASTGKSYAYASFYSDLIPEGKGGVRTLVTTLVTQPLLVLRVIFTAPKILLFLKLFVPLLFLPLFAPRRGWMLLAYGFAFIFLASRSAVYSTNFQYSVLIYPLAIVLVPLTLAELPRHRLISRLGLEPERLRVALVVGLLVTTVATSARFGALLPNTALRPGGQSLTWGVNPQRRPHYEWVQEAIATIPPDASVGASFRLGAHISNRMRATDFEDDTRVDYLLLDTNGLEEKAQKKYDRMATSGEFKLIRERRGFELWQRVPKKKPKARPPAAPI